MSFRNVQKRLRDGVWWVIIGRILGIATTFLLNAYLARVLGPSGFGGFVLAATLIALLSLVGMMGFNEALVRFVSERLAHRHAKSAALAVRKGLAISSVCLLIGAPLSWLALTRIDLGLAEIGNVNAIAILIVACAVLLAYQQLAAEALRGFHQLRWASLFAGGQSGGLFSSILLFGLILVGSVFFSTTLTSVLAWFLLALFVTLPFTYICLWRTGRSAITAEEGIHREKHVPSSRQMLAVGGSIMVIHTLAFVTQQADLWIAGAYCDPEELGLYGSARRLTLLAAMPVQIAMLAVISSIADLHVRGKRRHLQRLLRGTATLAAVPAALALAPLLAAPGDVLGLVFGDVYRGAAIPLVILALGYVPLILCGNPVHALTMTGRHGIAMTVNLITTCILLGTGPIVVRLFGVNGLACVSAGTLALQNVALWLCARTKCGIWTHVGAPAPVLRLARREQYVAPPRIQEVKEDHLRQQGRHPWRSSSAFLGRSDRLAPRHTPVVHSPARASLAPMERIWWLKPEIVFAVAIGVTALAATWLSQSAYRQYGTPKYFTNYYLVLACASIIAFTIGSWIASAARTRPSITPAHVESNLGRWFLAAVGLALFGYAIWGAVAVKNGLSAGALSRFLNLEDAQAADELKANVLQRIPGVTTATQFGIAAFLLGAWLWSRGKRWVLPVLFVLSIATLLRVVLNSERLALLEAAVPAMLVVLRTLFMERQWGPWVRRLVDWAPVFAVLGLLVSFGATEYLRSWRYYQNDFNSFAEFTIWRVMGYYTTALNNGAMAYEAHGAWPVPYDSLNALWEFPLIENSPLAYDALTGVNPEVVHFETLERFGNPELNNGSGLLGPLLDFGPLGMIVYWLLFGWLAGVLYRGFLAGSLAGMAFYPILYLSLLEAPRILYLPSGRAFAPLVYLTVFVLANQFGVASQAAGHPRNGRELGPRAAPAPGS